MSVPGLTGKKFVGKIVPGVDRLQRGRYFVHIPGLQPYMAETMGILLPNHIHPSRVTDSKKGTFGSNIPLQVDTRVEVEFPRDDISSGRIVAIVSDEDIKTDMGAGKLMSVEPSGKFTTISMGLDMDLPFNISELISSKIEALMNAGSKMASDLVSGIGEKISGVASEVGGKISDIASQAGDAAQSAISTAEAAVSKGMEAVQKVNSAKDSLGLKTPADGAFANISKAGKDIAGACAAAVSEVKSGVVGKTQDVIKSVMDKVDTPGKEHKPIDVQALSNPISDSMA